MKCPLCRRECYSLFETDILSDETGRKMWGCVCCRDGKTSELNQTLTDVLVDTVSLLEELIIKETGKK